MVKAVIDLGTNSFKCVIARVEESGSEVWEDGVYPCRLGAELAATGSIGSTARARALSALEEIKRRCRLRGVQKLLCVGAQTLRQARDAEVFREFVYWHLGWEVQILSGDEEARLTFLAAAGLAPSNGNVLVFDSGGGSTEFTLARGSEIMSTQSLPLGAVSLTRSFIPADPATGVEYSTLNAHIQAQLDQLFQIQPGTALIACGGGVSTMAAVSLGLAEYSAQRVDGTRLDRAELDRQLGLYRKLNLAERKLIPGLDPHRADIILAGTAIVAAVLKRCGAESLLVSTRGLRHALLASVHHFQDFG